MLVAVVLLLPLLLCVSESDIPAERGSSGPVVEGNYISTIINVASIIVAAIMVAAGLAAVTMEQDFWKKTNKMPHSGEPLNSFTLTM